jgi:hypothetical protein
MTQRTARALERARPEPRRSDYAALRAQISAGRFRRWMGGVAIFGVSMAAAVIAALTVTPRVEIGPRAEAAGLALAPLGERLPARRPEAAVGREGGIFDRGAPIALSEGAVLAGVDGRVIEAFGRHRISLDAGALVTVGRFEPAGVELTVEAGRVDFEVERATEAEVFRVHAGDVTVSVRGTGFAVWKKDGRVGVSVAHGRVAVDRPGVETTFLSGGEQVEFGVAGPVDNLKIETNRSAARQVRESTKVVAIDVGSSAMARPGEGLEVGNLVGPIMAAVRGGRCAQALKATMELGARVEVPRALVWVEAYCRRKLGDVAGSRLLFARYGPSGPWSVPDGDELPPLPE